MEKTNRKYLDPDTASKDRSIWKAIDRAALERQTQALFAKQHVTGHRSDVEPSDLEHDRSYPLPFEVEKSLADDFAFIAASQPQVDFVSAVAVEQSKGKHSFVMRLAANQGVSPDVEEKFDEMFELLRKHARKDITRDACQKQLFELIVQLSCNKILGRLGSTRFRRPMHLDKTRGPLPTRLRQLYSKNIRASFPRRNCQDLNRPDRQIGSFEAALQQLESGKSEELHLNVTRTIKQAFDLTEDGVKLPTRLEALGCPDTFLDTKAVREVGKVSNYWRISRHLAICSQRFRSHFATAEWYPLPSYRASSKSQVLSQQYVHAEIQLLVHYELTPPHLMPRTIGVSKEACFLCDSFIRAHGHFSVTGAHRQMFPQRTVPDLKEYGSQTIQQFRRVLSQVYVEVKEEHLKSQKKLPRRPFPLQSAINLNVIRLTTPSTSTLLPQSRSHSSDGARTIRSNKSSPTSMMCQNEQDVKLLEHDEEDRCGEANPRVSPIVQQKGIVIDHEQALAGKPIDIIVDEAVSKHTDGVRTFATFSTLPFSNLPTPLRQRFVGGSMLLQPASDAECQRTIHLADIPAEDELVLQRDSNDAPHEISLLL
ncbi:hypothetical protein LTR74_017675, partial [Friedmanniomyces endolithicus]